MNKLFALALTLVLVSPTFAATVVPSPAAKTSLLPDLAVVKLKAVPLKNGKLHVTYTVKNSGRIKSRPSVTRVTVSTAGIKEIQQELPALKPGDNVTQTIDYVIAKNGKYELKVTTDYLNQVRESNERNNDNTIKFGVSRTI